MKLKVLHNTLLILAVLLTAAALSALPFRLLKQDIVYVYTKGQLSSEETGFIAALKRVGYTLKINPQELPKAKTTALWLDTPNAVEEIKKSKARFNFIYTTAYYPLTFADIKESPVILTPYRELYEHYVRSNQKTALFSLGINPADFYKTSGKKIYPVLYYGDNNKIFPYAEHLKQKKDIRFMGDFWPADFAATQPQSAYERAGILSQSDVVIVYNDASSPLSKKMPQELAEAAACGALVFSTPNQVVTEVYGDNVITYENLSDLEEKLGYYLSRTKQTQHINRALQKITLEKYSSSISAKRFKELLSWLKQNTKLDEQ